MPVPRLLMGESLRGRLGSDLEAYHPVGATTVTLEVDQTGAWVGLDRNAP